MHRPRNRTLQELCDAVYWAVSNAPDEGITRLGICRALGRKKAPHIIEMIEHLHRQGYLVRRTVTTPQGDAFYYSLNPNPPYPFQPES